MPKQPGSVTLTRKEVWEIEDRASKAYFLAEWLRMQYPDAQQHANLVSALADDIRLLLHEREDDCG